MEYGSLISEPSELNPFNSVSGVYSCTGFCRFGTSLANSLTAI